MRACAPRRVLGGATGVFGACSELAGGMLGACWGHARRVSPAARPFLASPLRGCLNRPPPSLLPRGTGYSTLALQAQQAAARVTAEALARSNAATADVATRAAQLQDSQLLRIRLFEDTVKRTVLPIIPCSDAALQAALDACVPTLPGPAGPTSIDAGPAPFVLAAAPPSHSVVASALPSSPPPPPQASSPGDGPGTPRPAVDAPAPTASAGAALAAAAAAAALPAAVASDAWAGAVADRAVRLLEANATAAAAADAGRGRAVLAQLQGVDAAAAAVANAVLGPAQASLAAWLTASLAANEGVVAMLLTQVTGPRTPRSLCP